jgi:hypothetical protein
MIDGTTLSLGRLAGVVRIDRINRQATVWGGSFYAYPFTDATAHWGLLSKSATPTMELQRPSHLVLHSHEAFSRSQYHLPPGTRGGGSSLPDELKTFVDDCFVHDGYGSTSEYVRELIRRDRI